MNEKGKICNGRSGALWYADVLDARTEQFLEEVVGALRSGLGNDVISIALYGSATGPDYVEGKSDVNLVVVLESLEVRHLRALVPHVRAWRKKRIATPLLLDRAFLRNSLDVFPMEFSDLRERHRLLYGEDVFSSLDIDLGKLRDQCEREIRGKLLHLHEAYLELAGTKGAVEALLLDSLKAFVAILRGLNRLRGIAGTGSSEEVVAAFARAFGCELPALRELLAIRKGQAGWDRRPEDLFASYATELRQLVRVVDALPVGGTGTSA